jgi:hypothetical protein
LPSVQLGVNRQGENFLARFLCAGKIADAVAQERVGRLQVQGGGVIDLSRHAARFEISPERGAFFDPNRKLVIDMKIAIRFYW